MRFCGIRVSDALVNCIKRTLVSTPDALMGSPSGLATLIERWSNKIGAWPADASGATLKVTETSSGNRIASTESTRIIKRPGFVSFTVRAMPDGVFDESRTTGEVSFDGS